MAISTERNLSTDIELSTLSNSDYKFMQSELLLVREAVEGRVAIVKSSQVEIYIPDPTRIGRGGTPRTKEQQDAYYAYIHGAEYDNYADSTLTTWIGLLDFDKAKVEVSAPLEYLIDDFDGDGTSVFDVMELAASNVLQAKYHGFLAQYGHEFGDIPEQEMTAEEAFRAGLKSSAKSYQRENIIDWEFSVVNGIKQLSFIRLVEEVSLRDENYIESVTYNNYLTLALDEDGEYYQQMQYGGDKGGMSERVYPTANGAPLNFIPFVFIVDQAEFKNKLPRKLGALHPICRKAISRMKTSAVQNRAMDVIVPTPFTMGWKGGDAEMFKELNGGRDHIELGTGISNNMPGEVEVKVVSLSAENDAIFKKLDQNAQEARALGARFNTEETTGNKTAAEIISANAKEDALLTNIANSIASGFTDLLEYCAMFDGVENAEIDVVMDKNFTDTSISVERRKVVESNVLSGLTTREEGRKELKAGGVPIEDEDVSGL